MRPWPLRKGAWAQGPESLVPGPCPGAQGPCPGGPIGPLGSQGTPWVPAPGGGRRHATDSGPWPPGPTGKISGRQIQGPRGLGPRCLVPWGLVFTAYKSLRVCIASAAHDEPMQTNYRSSWEKWYCNQQRVSGSKRSKNNVQYHIW